MNGGDTSSTGADYEDDGLYELEGPLLSDGNVSFQLTTPCRFKLDKSFGSSFNAFFVYSAR